LLFDPDLSETPVLKPSPCLNLLAKEMNFQSYKCEAFSPRNTKGKLEGGG
jgi:hypothetical protein